MRIINNNNTYSSKLNDKDLVMISGDGYINYNEVPYVASRYIKSTWDTNEDVILDLYSCDYYQLDFKKGVYKDFTLRLILDGIENTYPIKSGEIQLNIGKQSVGEHKFIVQVIDSVGRRSHELYNEFRVIDKVEYDANIKANTYTVTDEDLILYGISKNDDETVALETKQGLQRLFNEKSAAGVRKIILPKGTYQIETEVYLSGNPETDDDKSLVIQYNKDVLSVPSNFIIDLNGSTIKEKTTPWWQNMSMIIAIDKCYDSHLINGTIEGDYRRRSNKPRPDGSPSKESGAACCISADSRYSSLEDLTITKFTGYTTSMGISPSLSDHAIVNFSTKFTGWTNVNVDDNGIEFVEMDKWTSDYYTVQETLWDKELVRVGQYLGIGWYCQADSWNVRYHFYDENKNHIKSIEGYQYREFIKPSNTRFIRVTYYCKTTKDRPNVPEYLDRIDAKLIYYYVPRNCAIRRLHFVDTRTCGLNPNQANNCLIEGCTFTECATNITPIAVDFEDGWYLMQDYMFRNNEVLAPVGTGDLVIDGGMGLVFEGNKNFRIKMQGHYGVGYLFRNNINTKVLKIAKGIRTSHGYIKVENETFSNGNFYYELLGDEDAFLIARNFIFNGVSGGTIPMKHGYFYNALFDNKDSVSQYEHGIIGTPNCRLINSVVKNYTGYDNGRTKLSTCRYINCEFLNFNGTIEGYPRLDNSTLNNINLTSNNYSAVLTIKDSTINTFHYNYVSWTSIKVTLNIENCIIDNSESTNGLYVLLGNFQWSSNNNSITIKFKNCTFKNDTKIANEEVLNNKNIKWELINNIFE